MPRCFGRLLRTVLASVLLCAFLLSCASPTDRLAAVENQPITDATLPFGELPTREVFRGEIANGFGATTPSYVRLEFVVPENQVQEAVSHLAALAELDGWEPIEEPADDPYSGTLVSSHRGRKTAEGWRMSLSIRPGRESDGSVPVSLFVQSTFEQ